MKHNEAEAGSTVQGEPTDVDALTNYLADQVEDECPMCGAYMLNPALHRDWHLSIATQLQAIENEARAWKPPPTYA